MITTYIKKLFYNSKEKRHQLVGPAKLWKMKQDFQIQFLKENGLKPGHKLIDIGCGTLRGGIPIINYLNEGNYYGIDVRKEVIKEAFNELKDEGLESKNPDIRTFQKFQELEYQVKFDVMFAFSVLIHLADEILDDCFWFAGKYLDANGKFYANVNIGERKDGKWQGFPIVFRSMDFYRKIASKYGLKISTIDQLKNLGHNSKMELGDKQVMLVISRA